MENQFSPELYDAPEKVKIEEVAPTAAPIAEVPKFEPVKMDIPPKFKPYVPAKQEIPRGMKQVVSEKEAPMEDPDLVGDRIEKVRGYFGRIEGTRPHVGADANNLTLPFGIVPDSVMVNGVEVVAGKNSLSNDVLKTNPDQVQLMTATKKVGDTVYKASDYNNYIEFSDAVLGAFEKEMVAVMPDLPEAALPTMLSSMWNVGTNSGMQNWSGFKDTVAELKKAEGSRDMHSLVAMGKHSFTGGRPSVGLLKRRMEDLNLSLPPEEQIAKVSQATVNGKPVMKVYDRDGNVIRTFKFNKKSINSDQEIDLEIDALDEVVTPEEEASTEQVDGTTGATELTDQAQVTEPVQETTGPNYDKMSDMEDGFYATETGDTVRVEGGKVYDLRTGARLDADAGPDTGPDVGTITAEEDFTVDQVGATVGETLGLSKTAQQKLSNMFGGVLGAKRGVEELAGANMLPNAQKLVEEGNYAAALAEIGFEVAGPLGDAAKASFIGLRSAFARSDAGKASINKTLEMLADGIDPDVVRKTTGWEFDPAGNMNFELDDSWMTVNLDDIPVLSKPQTSSTAINIKGINLDKAINHPELIDNYPQLKDIKVARMTDDVEIMKGKRGFANRMAGVIAIHADESPKAAKEIILHETQHIIQGIEDWVTGSSIAKFYKGNEKNVLDSARKPVVDALENLKMDPKEFTPTFSAMVGKYMEGGEEALQGMLTKLREINLVQETNLDYKLGKVRNYAEYLAGKGLKNDMISYANDVDTYYVPAASDYFKTYGEMQARNTQRSANLTDFERRAQSPASREDVPRSQAQDAKGNVLQEKIDPSKAHVAPRIQEATDIPEAIRVAASDSTSGFNGFSNEAITRAVRDAGRKSRSVVTEIRIDDFLRLAAKGERAESTARLANVTEIDEVPILNTEVTDGVAQVVGHEGRHRARRLKEMGYETMPVTIRDRHIRWDQQDNPQSFDYEENFPTQLRAEEGEGSLSFPISRGEYRFSPLSKDEWTTKTGKNVDAEINKLDEEMKRAEETMKLFGG